MAALTNTIIKGIKWTTGNVSALSSVPALSDLTNSIEEKFTGKQLSQKMISMKLCQDRLSCPVCFDIYVEPCLLQCQHSICKKCLYFCIKNEMHLGCPVCGSLTNIEEWTFDTRTDEFVNFIKSDSNSLTNCSICGEDVNPREVSLCKECEKIFCEECCSAHSLENEFHTVFKLIPNVVQFCSEHERKFEFYCNAPTCKTLLCSNCILHDHEGHEKRTIHEQLSTFYADIGDSVENAKERIMELKSYKDYASKLKISINEKFREIESIADERRDVLIKIVNDAHENKIRFLAQKKWDIIEGFKEKIEEIEILEAKYSSILMYSFKYLEQVSFDELRNIREVIDCIFSNASKYNLQVVDCESLTLISQKLNEDDLYHSINDFIGKLDVKTKESDHLILTNEKSLFFYKEVIANPTILSKQSLNNAGLCDILYDAERRALFSLRFLNNENFLLSEFCDQSISKFIIVDSCFGHRRSYMAKLRNGNIMLLRYAKLDTADQLLLISNDMTTSEHFPILFCNVKRIKIICSIPAKNILFLYSNEGILYKYYMDTSKHEEYKLDLEGVPSFMAASDNEEYISFGGLKQVHIYSFTQKAMHGFGHSNGSYNGIAFLTENILIAATNGSLKIFNANERSLIKKIDYCKDGENEDFAINQPFLITKCSDSTVIFSERMKNQNYIYKLSL